MKKFKTKTMEIDHLKKELKRWKGLALIDDLTGLYNHRKLFKDIKRYSALNKRYGIKFIVMLIDVDDFKKINDSKGHLFGDKILIKTADILKKTVRHYEKVYRFYQGDEFMVIFSHTGNIEKAIDRIRKNLQEENINISVGYSRLCKDIFDVIDKKMYKQKQEHKKGGEI